MTLPRQTNEYDCGPLCLQMLLENHGYLTDLDCLRTLCKTTKNGTTLQNMREALCTMGFDCLVVKLVLKRLQQLKPPFIVNVNNFHFVLIAGVNDEIVSIADPANGMIELGLMEFDKIWTKNDERGYVLVVNI